MYAYICLFMFCYWFHASSQPLALIHGELQVESLDLLSHRMDFSQRPRDGLGWDTVVHMVKARTEMLRALKKGLRPFHSCRCDPS